jgi:ubiquinone/menaquinone biosynthesis C-methylase UbiE
MDLLGWARRSGDLSIEGGKAREYDEFSREHRIRDLKRYAVLAAGQVPEGGSVLDVATGPGYFCTELAKLGDFHVTGLDISEDLVAIARSNALSAGVDVDFVQGSASAMPFADGAFDLVFCSWAVKNFMDPARALHEMYRVLKPGGTALVVDVNRDATNRQWNTDASDIGLKGMDALFMKVAFTIQRSGAYSRGRFEELIAETPFEKHDIQSEGIDLCICLFK